MRKTKVKKHYRIRKFSPLYWMITVGKYGLAMVVMYAFTCCMFGLFGDY